MNMGSALGKGLCPWQPTKGPWADPGALSTLYLHVQCAEGLKGEKGESGSLVSVGPGIGQGYGVLAQPPLTFSPLLLSPPCLRDLQDSQAPQARR